ncbi:MAG: hypothetical protein ACK5CA_02490 [Cyanobacteriota bacterium]
MINSFGFYEDDWVFAGHTINYTAKESLDRVSNAVVTFWQGRPLHMTFLTFIPWFGAKLGGLNALYSIGFLILGFNACLYYFLLRKTLNQPYLPALAVLFFCLYPADTTFNYLTHLFGIQTSLLFLLFAFYLFALPQNPLRIQEKLSYLLAILSLLTYESLFLVFFIAPFFRKEKVKKKEIIRHVAYSLGIVLFYVLLRKIAGESRISDLSLLSAVQTLIFNTFLGPIISLGTFFWRPWQILTDLNTTNIWIIILGTPAIYLMIRYLFNLSSSETRDRIEELIPETLKFIKLGLAMTVLAYPPALLLSVTMIDGRASRVHFAAVLGTTIIVAGLWALLLLKIYPQKIWRRIIPLLVALHLSLLLAFSVDVQKDYSLSWQYQQNFWRDVLTLAPDITENTVILLQAPNLQWGKQINPFDWSVLSILDSIYQFPKTWQFAPRLYILNANGEDWKKMIQPDGQFLLSNKNNGVRYHYEWEPERFVKASDVILLVEEDKQLTRKFELEKRPGEIVSLKDSREQGQAPTFPKTLIFERLIGKDLSNTSDPKSAIYLGPQK